MRLRFPINLLLLCAVTATVVGSIARAADRIPDGQRFVDLLARGEFDAAVAGFDATMKGALPAPKLKEAWSGVVASVGPFQKQGAARLESAGGYDIVHVTCVFEKASLDAKVVFNATGQVAGLFFAPLENPDPAAGWKAPAYVRPDAFTESDVTVGSGEWALPGTLSRPKGDGHWPAVILVHGSGPHDRDETIGPNKPFRDLAGGLASRGVAVLRYEKRTKQYGPKMAALKHLTVQEETIDDAVAAAALLRATPGIDPKRIFVLGHSLGGTVAPRIAAADPALAGLIVLAGSARPLEAVTLEQLDYIASLGATSDAEKKQIAAMRADIARLQALDPAKADPAENFMGASAGYWFELRAHAPADEARALKCPMLILQGERDYQVTPADFALWKAALAGRADVTLASFPDLNHLFMTGRGKATPAEYQLPGHVAPEVVEKIAGWVTRSAEK